MDENGSPRTTSLWYKLAQYLTYFGNSSEVRRRSRKRVVNILCQLVFFRIRGGRLYPVAGFSLAAQLSVRART